MKGEETENKKIGCTVNLMNFYKSEINKEEMYIRYIHKLCDMHLQAENYTEAAFTLLLYCELLQWEDRPLREFLHYPSQTEWQRKEGLCRKIIHYFNKGKSWEFGIPLCRELACQYESLYDYQSLSWIRKMEASYYDNIMEQQRLEPEFFRVGFYGRKFPFFLRLLGRLRQENRLNPGGGGCRELRWCHCTPAWVTGVSPIARLEAVAQSRLTQLPLSGFKHSPASASRVAGTTGTHHHVRLIFRRGFTVLARMVSISDLVIHPPPKGWDYRGATAPGRRGQTAPPDLNFTSSVPFHSNSSRHMAQAGYSGSHLNLSTLGAEASGSPEIRSSRLAWPTWQNSSLLKIQKLARHDGGCLQSQLFGRLRRSLALSPGCSAVAQPRLTATSTSQVQVILLPQPP
ncbi:Dedicator of cytokinesis protein 3, partial [Plecturocebus cupreus]